LQSIILVYHLSSKLLQGHSKSHSLGMKLSRYLHHIIWRLSFGVC